MRRTLNRVAIAMLWVSPLAFMSCDVPIDFWIVEPACACLLDSASAANSATSRTCEGAQAVEGTSLTVPAVPCGVSDQLTISVIQPAIDLKTEYPTYFQDASVIESIAIPELWVEVGNLQSNNKATQVAGVITIGDPTDSTFTPITINYGSAVDAAGVPVDSTGKEIAGAVSICSAPFSAAGVLTCGIPIIEGGRLDLTPNATAVSSLEAQMKKTGALQFSFTGSIDQLPANFDITGEVHLQATISTGAAASVAQSSL